MSTDSYLILLLNGKLAARLKRAASLLYKTNDFVLFILLFKHHYNRYCRSGNNHYRSRTDAYYCSRGKTFLVFIILIGFGIGICIGVISVIGIGVWNFRNRDYTACRPKALLHKFLLFRRTLRLWCFHLPVKVRRIPYSRCTEFLLCRRHRLT